MTASFEALYEKTLKGLNENVPVDLAPGVNIGAGAGVPISFTDTANYKITPEQAARVIDSVVDYLQTRNGHSPLPYRSFQTDVIADKIVVYSALNPTKAKYAARVVYNAMKDAGIISDERSKGTGLVSEPTPEEVDEVADTVSANSEEVPVAPQKPEREKIEIPDEEEASVFFKASDFPVEEVTPEEEEVLYTAWEKLPSQEDIEWSDIVKSIGLTQANKLKDIKAILPTAGSSTEQGEGSPYIEDEDAITSDDDVTDTDWRYSQSEVEKELDPYSSRTSSGYRDRED